MAEEGGKGVSLVILGIVAIIAVVGLVLLFKGAVRGAAASEVATQHANEQGLAANANAQAQAHASEKSQVVQAACLAPGVFTPCVATGGTGFNPATLCCSQNCDIDHATCCQPSSQGCLSLSCQCV